MMLPSFYNLPVSVALSAGIGYICGKIADSSPSLWAKVSVINSLVGNILFIVISSPIDDLKSKCKIFSLINTVNGIVEIIALRHFNLIATTGTLLLGGTLVWSFIYTQLQIEKL